MRSILASLSALLMTAFAGISSDCSPTGTAEISVRLFSPGLTWRVPAGTHVEGRLLRGDTLLGTASAVAADDGVAQLWFLATEGAGRPYAVIEPGLRADLRSEGGASLQATVPLLYVDVDADADRVGGISERGATILVTLLDGTGTTRFDGSVAAADSGAFQLDLGGQVDIGPGYRGVAAIEQGSLRYECSLAAFVADVDLDNSLVSGVSVAGTRLHVEVLDGQGATRGQGFASVEQDTPVDGENDWSVAVRDPAGAAIAIDVGDRLAVSRVDSPLAGGPAALELTVPALSIAFDLEAQTIWGLAPHGGTALLTITLPDGRSAEMAIHPDSAGEWSIRSSFEAGSRLRLTLAVRPDLRLRRSTSVEQLRLALHTSAWMALGEAGREVHLKLLGATGEVRAAGTCVPSADGEAICSLGDEAGSATMLPGDRLVATLGSGRQVTLTLPSLTARADIETDTVSGEGPPGSLVVVAAQDQSEVLRREVTVGPDGRFALAWGEELDLDTDAAGSAQLALPGGHRLLVHWVAARLQVPLYASSLWAYAPVGREVATTVTSIDGALVASASATAKMDYALLRRGAAPAARVLVELRPRGSRTSSLRPGDVIAAAIGDAAARFELPELELRAEPDRDRVTGRTAPDRVVRLSVNQGRDAAVEVRADRAGDFAWSVAEHDLLGGDLVQAGVVLEKGHTVQRTIRAPYLRLGLHDGAVAAYVDALSPATVLLRGRQGLRGQAEAVADRTGLLSVVLRGADAGRLLPDPDDDLVAEWRTGNDARQAAMTVPELSLEWDVARDRVWGTARPWPQAEWLEVSVWPLRTFGATAVPAPAGDGAWTLDLNGRAELAPGTRIEATLRDAGGNLAMRCRNVPLVRAPQGGSRVEGLADPLQVVTATLRDAGGRLLAAGAGRATEAGDWSLVLAGDSGTSPTTDGQVVAVDIGTGTIEVELPRFEVTPDWSRGAIAGFGPADSALEMRGSSGCRPSDPRHVELVQWPAVRTGPDGSLSAVGDFLRGDRITLTHLTDAAQEVYVRLVRPLALVDVAAGVVSGCATPFVTLRASLHAEDGALRDRREAAADHDGAYALAFVGRDGAPMAVMPTDYVLFEADNESSRIPSDYVTVETGDGPSVSGRALPGRPYVLEFRLADGRIDWLELTAGSDGAFRIDEWGLRALNDDDWSLGQVETVLVHGETAGGHYLTAASAGSTRPRRSAYFPNVVR